MMWRSTPRRRGGRKSATAAILGNASDEVLPLFEMALDDSALNPADHLLWRHVG
jgi:hypothetical protein